MHQKSWKTRSQLDDVRRAQRLSVTIDASLREHGTTKFQVKVIDLSVTGFRCETSFTLNPGTRVWLTIPGFGGLEASVAWRDKFSYGFAFDHALHPAIFDHIKSKYTPE
jgi:hypothetical protein